MGEPHIYKFSFSKYFKRWYIRRCGKGRHGTYTFEYLWSNLTWHTDCEQSWGGYYKTRGLAKAVLDKWERTVP